jgi:hypothetical protein
MGGAERRQNEPRRRHCLGVEVTRLTSKNRGGETYRVIRIDAAERFALIPKTGPGWITFRAHVENEREEEQKRSSNQRTPPSASNPSRYANNQKPRTTPTTPKRAVASLLRLNRVCINRWQPPNDPSSATRRRGGNDWNRDAPAGFAAAHGWHQVQESSTMCDRVALTIPTAACTSSGDTPFSSSACWKFATAALNSWFEIRIPVWISRMLLPE